MRGSGIDVIGDVEDLRPVPPAGGRRRGRTPTGPAARRWSTPPLDAMVALALEAATRPDPHEQLAARIGRAARRLRGR